METARARFGVSVPWAVTSDTESPTATPSCAARSVPRRMPGRPFGGVGQRLEAAALERALQVGDARLELGIDAFDLHRRLLAAGRQKPLAHQRRRRANDVWQLRQLRRFGAVIDNAAGRFRDVDVRVRPEDPVAQLALQPGHHREGDDDSHHADRDAECRDQRNDGDERLLPLREKIAQRDLELEGNRALIHVCASAETG